MAVDRYIVSRSNYSIKTKHKTTAAGRIYERDYMTTTQNGSFHGDVFPFSENNFKMVRRMSSNGMRKHNFGDWLKQDVCVDGTNTGEYWTLNCISNDTHTSTKTIKIKPNFGSLLDFAYYGSCVELIKTSVSNILKNYPAELYVKDSVVYYYDKNFQQSEYFGFDISNDITHANRWLSENGKPMLDGPGRGVTRLVEISNPFNIDVFKKHVDYSKDSDINKLRFFCLSSNNYNINNPSGTMMACACDWEVLYKKDGCYDGEFTGCVMLNSSLRYPENSSIKKFYIYEYYSNGEYYLLTDISYNGVTIRPTQALIEQYFESLTDFERLLLNRNTIPLYTCTIDYPHETDKGVMTYKKSLTWPTYFGWNLDVTTSQYTDYIESLLNLAEFYDEGYTNNLWNMMTHDSIKNMDLTYTRANSTEDTDDYRTGTARMENVIMMYGRFFDDIKRSIDNIKSVNVVTYNQYSNTPDYFLSDSLELSGWEVYSSVNGLDTNAAFYSMMDGTGNKKVKTRKYTVSDTDNEFMRNLKLNSRSIFSMKGSKAGIESLLSLFGMVSYDFRKTWYEGLNVSARTDFVKTYNKRYSGSAPASFDALSGNSRNNFYNMFDYTLTEYVNVASGGESGISVNSNDSLIEKYNSYKEGFDSEGDSLQGLPCAFFPSKDGMTYYIVPWFDKLEEYDGNPYFQMYGGWGKMYKKRLEENNLTLLEEIYSTKDRTVSATTETQFLLDDFIDGEYTFDGVAVGDDYDYSIVSGDTEWQYCFIGSVNSGDTVMVASAITSGNTDITDSRIIAIGADNKVTYVANGVSGYTCNNSGTTVIVSQKNYDEFIVTWTNVYDKTVSGVRFYDESFKYINIVRTLSDLQSVTLDRLHGNDIFYVYDLSEYIDKYGEQPSPNTSHYFILNDTNSGYYFKKDGDDRGWENIPNYDIEHGLNDGLRVLYLESLIDDNKGNAPHIGKGMYDDGEEFLEYFRKLFYYSIKNEAFNENAYDCYTGELKTDEIEKIGFELVEQKDNMKCWYFTNTDNNKMIYALEGDDGELVFTPTEDKAVKVGKDAEYDTTYKSWLEPKAFETGVKNYDESAAYSVINTKKLRIQFNGKYVLGDIFRDYLYSSVLPYLKQIIPSTTLLEISILGEEASLGKFEKGKAAGLAEDSVVLTNRYNAKNSEIEP